MKRREKLLTLLLGDERGKLHALFNRIREGIRPPVLIFVQTKEKAVTLYEALILEELVSKDRIDYISTERDPNEVCMI